MSDRAEERAPGEALPTRSARHLGERSTSEVPGRLRSSRARTKGATAGSRGPWRTLLHPHRGSSRGIHVLVALLFIVLGLVATTTVRSRSADPLAGLNEDQLVAILADLDTAEESLVSERLELQRQLAELSVAADAQQAAEEASEQALSRAEVAAGTLPVQGPGIVAHVYGDASAVPVSVFVTTLAELRNAGAEAISLNGVRLNVRAWFGEGSDGELVASGVALTPPYEWRAIGDADTLSVALEIRGGAVSQFEAYGAEVQIDERSEVVIDAVTEPLESQWASPATE